MEIVWMLHGDVLARLRQTLKPCKVADGVDDTQARMSLESFVMGIYRVLYLEYGPEDRSGGVNVKNLLQIERLAERMCILFDLVDIDNAGVVEWVDFTDFCVRIRGGGMIEHGNGRGASHGGERNQQEDIPRYSQNLDYADRVSHCHEIKGMRFAEKLGFLVVVDGTHLLKLYAAGLQKVAQIEPAIEMAKIISDKTKSAQERSVSNRKTRASAQRFASTMMTARTRKETMAVQAVEFIGSESEIAVSCADGFLTIWDLKIRKIIQYTRMKRVQMGLRFCPAMDVLASWGTGNFNHDVLVWDVTTLKVIHILSGHSGPIKDVCEVASGDAKGAPFNTMIESSELDHSDARLYPHDRATASVTAGMDSKVISWDLWLDPDCGKMVPKKAFILTKHNHGVLSLAYSDEHELIISAGFDVMANCWDRCSNHVRMRLVGHRVSLIGVAIVRQETQRAVTGDEGGNFRLWDIRRGPYDHGTCLQTFSLDNARAMPRTMVIAWQGGLIAADSKLYVFHAGRHVAARVVPRGAWFLPYTGELCVLLNGAVVLDARTGEVLRHICHQTRGREITALCLDSRCKKAVIGDQRGDLEVYDAITGRWAISAVPHRAQVSALLFVDEDGTFISAGWDRKIQVHNARVCSGKRAHGWTQRSSVAVLPENTSYGHRHAGVLRSVEDAHDGDITLMAASFRLGLLVTASTDLTVRVWDYTLLRLKDVIIGHRREISCVCFLDPLPCLATADMTGKILLWSIGPLDDNKATVLLAAVRNTVVVVKRKILPSPITALAFLYSKDAPAEATVSKVMEAENPGNGDKNMVIEPQPSAETSGGSRHGKSLSTQMHCTLFVGDEVGSIKAWDMTNILLEKLGPTPYDLGPTVDTAMIPPRAGGKNSHQFVHHRRGPLHGVGAKSALRLRELIEIAKVLRRGDYEPPTTELPGADTEQDQVSSRADPNDDKRPTKNSTPWHARPSNNRGQFANILLREGTHDLVDPLLDQENDPHAERQVGGRGPKSHRFSVALEDEEVCKQGMGQQAYLREQVEAVLNIQVDNFDPVASWKGHTDAVTSIQAICSPPSLLTGSLDGSVRIFDLNGSLLGVVTQENEPGSAPWLFRPPTTGREADARERAAGLVEKLKALRRIRQDSPRRQDTAGNRDVSADSRVLSADNDLRGLMPVNGNTETNPIVSATNLSKVKEARQSRVSMRPDKPEKGTTADKQSIGAELKDNVGGRKSWQPNIDEDPRSTSLAQRGQDRLGERTARNPPRVLKEKSLDPRKAAPNLYMEQQRKHIKKTRSTLQFLSLSLNRTESFASPVGCLRPSTATISKKVTQGQAHSSARPRTAPPKRSENAKDWSRKDETRRSLISVRTVVAFSSTPSRLDERTSLAPTRTLRLEDEAASKLLLKSKASKQTLGHHRSAMEFWLASSRSNSSLKDELAKRRTAERRRRRIDCILNKVCQLGKNTFPTPPVSSGNDGRSRAPGLTASQSWTDDGDVGRRTEGAAIFTASTRVRQVLSRFECCVSEDVGNRTASPATPGRQTQNDGYGNSGDQKHDNINVETSKNSRQYLQAKRSDRVSSQEEAHQNCQEVTVGLNKPSGERFRMYNLHEVLEFQAFAQSLSSQGTNHLTIQELMDNSDVQANPRHCAFLQELARTKAIPWKKTLSQEDLMQVVFHSAKHEDIHRMINIMNIANMLQRLRDTFVVAKDPLLTDDGALSHCLDVETTTRQTANSEMCTLRELHGIMTWVGSDLFSLGEEKFEALSAQCGVHDMNKALTAGEITAIITKLASLHHRQD